VAKVGGAHNSILVHRDEIKVGPPELEATEVHLVVLDERQGQYFFWGAFLGVEQVEQLNSPGVRAAQREPLAVSAELQKVDRLFPCGLQGPARAATVGHVRAIPEVGFPAHEPDDKPLPARRDLD